MNMRIKKLGLTKRAIRLGLSMMMTAVMGAASATDGCSAAAHPQGSGSKQPYPQPYPAPSRGGRFPSEPEKVFLNVTLEGEHVALGEQVGSGSKHGKLIAAYGFKVTRAVGKNDEELSNLRGVTLRYRETGKSKDLIKKHRAGEKLVIKGKLDVEENVLEVGSFQAAGSPGSNSHGSDSKRQGSGSK
jgi:hypothetical protein